MRLFQRRLLGCVVAAVTAVGFVGVAASAAAANPISSFTCAGGSIPAGTYSSLVINGACVVDSGNVSVTNNVAVLNGKELIAAFGSADGSTSKLIVGGNVAVGANAVLVLGCEPGAFKCLNDPDTNENDPGTFAAADSIGGSVSATNALAVLVHNSTIRQNLALIGGGGGVNCNSQAALQGSPAYATFEDTHIGGNLSIVGWRSCWLGTFRTHVVGNVTFNNNMTADPDGNELADNTITGNFSCSGNSPTPWFGDSQGGPNHVVGNVSGQCTSIVGT